MDDFEYSIDGETISLERYNGDSKILEISPTMEVGGKTYNTDLSDFQVYSSSVKTLIIDEGITQIHTSIFNGSDVETLFFPKSLSQIYDYTLAYLHPDEEAEKYKCTTQVQKRNGIAFSLSIRIWKSKIVVRKLLGRLLLIL